MAELIHIDIEGTDVPIIFEQDNRLPIVSLQLVIRNSGYITDIKPGVAKMAAKLLGEGTQAEGSIAFATALENRAVSLHAGVGAETFVLTLSSLESEFAFGCEMLIRLLKDPNITQEAFTKIRTQTIGALTQKQSDFDYVAGTQLQSLLFEGTPLAHPASGSIESAKQITLADLTAYLNNYLDRESAILVIGGNLDEKEARTISRSILECLPKVETASIDRITPRSIPAEKIKQTETEQTYLYFGAPYDMPYDSDEVYLGKVASFVLGSSGFGSRLMEEVRVKRGLAYSAYGSFSVNRSHSYFTGYLQTKLESGDEAKRVVQEVVNDFIAKGITDKELEGAKQFLLGSEPLRNETLQQRLGRAFGEYYADRELGYQKEELKQIEVITLEEINAFIGRHHEIGKLSFSVVTR